MIKLRETKGMKVLHVVQGYDISGRSKITSALNTFFNKKGIESHIVVLSSRAGFAEKTGEEVRCLNKKEGFDLRMVFRLVKLINELEIDIIQTHGRGAMYYGLMAKPLSRAKKIVHASHLEDKNAFSGHPLLRAMERNLDCVIGVSDSVLKAFEEGVSRDVAVKKIIYNGVDLKRFDRPYRRGKRESEIVVGMTANLNDQKDHDTLCHAFWRFLEKFPEARLKIAGDGPRMEEVKALVDAIGIDVSVDLLGLRDDVVDVIKGFDIFVLSTKNEGFAVALLEAMACRVPVVATDIGPTREIIDHGRDGLLFEMGNEKELARCLEILAVDRDKREAMIEAAYEKVAKKFSEEAMAEQYIDAYKNLLL